MNRRDLLKKGSIILATPIAIGLSGCSSNDGGDGNGGDGGGEDGTPTATATPTQTATTTPTQTATVTGTVENELSDAFEIVEHSGRPEDQKFVVTAEVKNVGDRAADVTAHTFEVRVFDADDEDISMNPSGASTSETQPTEPGEITTMEIFTTVTTELSDVASYVLSVDCSGSFADGVYCSSG